MAEKDNLAADFILQPTGRLDFCEQETSREKPARLLAKTDDRFGTHES
jgi:hypothetical protein